MTEHMKNGSTPTMETIPWTFLSTTEFYMTTTGNNSGFVEIPINIPILNQPLQTVLLALILFCAILTNSAIVLNVSRDNLKRQMVHFLLIRHLCITDLVGAIFVLPIPLVSIIKGRWAWGAEECYIISMTTASCWTMHLVAVLLYRIDRIFAVWLPTGMYPLVSTGILNGLLVLTWIAVFSGCCIATLSMTPVILPALALSIPKVPLDFFIVVFTFYCVGIIALTTGYAFVFIRKLRKKKKERLHRESAHSKKSNHKVAKPAATKLCIYAGYAVSIGHLILYLVAMVTVAFIGEHLPPGAAFACGLVVYCDFIIQPVSLLLFSAKLRTEVMKMIWACVRVKAVALPQMSPSTSVSITESSHGQ